MLELVLVLLLDPSTLINILLFELEVRRRVRLYLRRIGRPRGSSPDEG